jgi:hypothetical protein
VFAVDAPCEDLGDGGLSRAVLAAEEISMCELPGNNRLPQSTDGSFLTYDIVKSERSVLSVENDMIFHS